MTSRSELGDSTPLLHDGKLQGDRCLRWNVSGAITHTFCSPFGIGLKSLACQAALLCARMAAVAPGMCQRGALMHTGRAQAGVWRAHVEKFSPEWFVAVHATIPFIAMLRKACLMPKWAITLTVASAIIGQVPLADLSLERCHGLQPRNRAPQTMLSFLIVMRERFALRPRLHKAALSPACILP